MDTTPDEITDAGGWKFWVAWIAGSALFGGVGVFPSFYIGLLFALFTIGALGLTTGEAEVFLPIPTAAGRIVYQGVIGAVSGAIYGTVIGMSQWFVLRRRIALAGWWVLASAVGGLAGGAIGGLVGWEQIGIGAIGIGTVAGLGVAQWLIARRYPIVTVWWVLASVCSAAVSVISPLMLIDG